MEIESRAIQGILFDLDGTFADTALDLAYALNRTLDRYNRPALPFDVIRTMVSHGGAALIRLGFNIGPEAPDFEEKRRYLLDVYKDNICRETRLFDGIDNLLLNLERDGLPWGIVTNKPSWLTDPLMEALAMTARASSIVSGDTCENNKPHPQPILHACEQMSVEPSRCIYVGDAERDIAAGNAAGTPTVAALYGYLLPDDDPRSWNPDTTIEDPAELQELLFPSPGAIVAMR